MKCKNCGIKMNFIDYYFCSGLCDYCIAVYMSRLREEENIISKREIAKREKDYNKIDKIVNS